MTKALENANKLRAWADPMSFGADPTGALPSDAAFALARATGRPLRIPAGTFLLNAPLVANLLIGQDFSITGEGPEISRLVFGPDAVHGIAINYSTNAGGQMQGDKTGVVISGLDLETRRPGAGSAVRLINTPPAGQVNETQVAATISNLRINGETDAGYWDAHIELENVTYPNILNVESQEPFGRGVGISLNCTGGYSAVEFAITNYRANGTDIALKIRGRCEGVYLNNFVAVGGNNGIDWQAVANPGKKPLLGVTGSHINVNNIAVKAIDVSQIIFADSLVYVTNSTTEEKIGFYFGANNAATSENHQIKGVTLIGLGVPTGSLSKGIKIAANVFGCTLDVKIEGLGVGIQNAGQRNFIAPSTTIANCLVRTIGFTDLGYYGEPGNSANVDGSLQLEFSGALAYSRDQSREQLRAGTYVFTAAGGIEEVAIPLERPFRNDASVIVACLGEPTQQAMNVYPKLASSTKDTLKFTVSGATAGAEYRLNYIAYGY